MFTCLVPPQNPGMPMPGLLSPAALPGLGLSSQGSGEILQMTADRAGMQEDAEVCESKCRDEHPSWPPSSSSSSTVPEAHLGSSHCTHPLVFQENHGAIPRQKSTTRYKQHPCAALDQQAL